MAYSSVIFKGIGSSDILRLSAKSGRWLKLGGALLGAETSGGWLRTVTFFSPQPLVFALLIYYVLSPSLGGD